MLALAGCARVQHAEPLPPARGAPVTAPDRLRIVIFELGGVDLPFHTGLIVRSGGRTTIYDPAGIWEPVTDTCTRQGEVLSDVTPTDEEAYLARTGIRYSLGDWVVHVFDLAVPRDVAALAVERMAARPLSLPLHCTQNVSSLLAGLPGLGWITPHHVTADFLADLLARDDLTYTRRTADRAQTG